MPSEMTAMDKMIAHQPLPLCKISHAQRCFSPYKQAGKYVSE